MRKQHYLCSPLSKTQLRCTYEKGSSLKVSDYYKCRLLLYGNIDLRTTVTIKVQPENGMKNKSKIIQKRFAEKKKAITFAVP